jgi:hypothetical protein
METIETLRPALFNVSIINLNQETMEVKVSFILQKKENKI